MRFWVSSPLLSTIPRTWATEGVVLLFGPMDMVPPMPACVGADGGPREWVWEGRCLTLGPGWAVLLCHLAQSPESILGAGSTPVKWGGGGGWGCYGPCDSRDIKAWPAKTSSLTTLATPPGPGRAAAFGGMSGGLGPCCPPGSPSSDHCSGGAPSPEALRCSQFPDSMGGPGGQQRGGCSFSEGGAVEGLGTGPHPGLSLLGHPG